MATATKAKPTTNDKPAEMSEASAKRIAAKSAKRQAFRGQYESAKQADFLRLLETRVNYALRSIDSIGNLSTGQYVDADHGFTRTERDAIARNALKVIAEAMSDTASKFTKTEKEDGPRFVVSELLDHTGYAV